MPRKVILHGDALKLLYTFLDYAAADPDALADAMNYDPVEFRIRSTQLGQQLQEGVKVDWDDLDKALKQQERESNEFERF